MAGYQPTLNDIPESEGAFTPSYADIPASEQLIGQAQMQEPKEPMPQMQEEFSNPTQWPGFEKLSPEEQQQRISLSQFDPANQTATGGFVPPGSFESPITRAAASFLPTLLAPEFEGGWPIVRGAANAISRIGTGAAGNVAYQSPNIKNMEDLKRVWHESANANAMLEAGAMVPRAVAGAAEIYSPGMRYAAQKANEIRRDAVAARSLQRETYRPVFDRYGDTTVTNNPQNYLANLGIERRQLYPEAKKIYDEFMQNPTFQRLHDFQSKLGGDIRKTALAGNKPRTTQVFEQYRNALQDEATNFLSRDQNALNSYNMGSQITRDLVEPFNATPILKQISRGTRQNVMPNEITNSIKKGREKITSTRGNNVFTAIPENHPLVRHYNDVTARMHLGEGLQNVVPEFVKKALPNVPGIIQNPLIGNVFRNLEPAYYVGGRVVIGNNQNQ